MKNLSPTKTIGIVGVTAEGAALCYKTIVSESAKYWGQYHHPEILLHNPSFHRILEAQKENDWKTVSDILSSSAKILASSGAEYIVIPANSIHFAIRAIQQQSTVPILSMLEVVQQECIRLKYKKIGVLGIGITMSKGLYDTVLSEVGIQTKVPTPNDQN